MTDHLDQQIETADHAVQDMIATLHEREMHAFHSLHDVEGHLWAGKVDDLQHVRDLLHRSAFIATP